MNELINPEEEAKRPFLIAEIPRVAIRAAEGNVTAVDVLRMIVTYEAQTRELREYLRPYYGPGDAEYLNISDLAIHHIKQLELSRSQWAEIAEKRLGMLEERERQR